VEDAELGGLRRLRGFLEAAAARFFGGMEISGLGCAYEI
jgi:hypothetical protein